MCKIAAEVNDPDDDVLSGFLDAIIERRHGWDREVVAVPQFTHGALDLWTHPPGQRHILKVKGRSLAADQPAPAAKRDPVEHHAVFLGDGSVLDLARRLPEG